MSSDKSATRILILVFSIIGLTFFCIGAGFLIEHLTFLQRAEETTAIITDIQTFPGNDGITRRAYVSYEVDGKEYTVRLNSYTSSMEKGQQITVQYDPKTPDQVRDPLWWLFPCIFGGLGLIFLLVVVILLIVRRRKRAGIDQLLSSGTQITASINEVQRNANYRVNGQAPYIILCAWKDPDDGKTYLFRSDNLWFNPEPILAERGITTLPVYLDMYDKRRYHVSLDIVQQDVVVL